MMGLLDKLALIGSKVTSSKELSSTITAFRTSEPSQPAILKFSYSGNVQYHKLSSRELAVLIKELADIQDSLETSN